MTQLLRWLGFVCVFLAVWIALVTKSVALDIPEQWMSVLHYLHELGKDDVGVSECPGCQKYPQGFLTQTIVECMESTLYELPIYLLMSFACYSLAVVGYRVATFNNCPEAAEELKQEIQDARKDLTKKGFKFT